MRNYGVNGLEINVGDGDRLAVRYYIEYLTGYGWCWSAYEGETGVSAGYSGLPHARTRDEAVTGVAEHYAARLGY